jgi:basic amino acid/polyamine antiporter, APA family
MTTTEQNALMAINTKTASLPESDPKSNAKLKKELGLFDVYAICTGAMFSSGFFLLPGLAAAQTGSSVALAYLIAGILMLPAMFSMAELSTAMPRAGGDYYFLDRAMGPLVGTIGGVGTYLALTLKSAFALIGMGAYLALFFNVNIQLLAVALTFAFTALNIFGAKETTGLQRLLIIVLVSVMAVFVASGVLALFGIGAESSSINMQFTPFLADGVTGLLATVGFVFVSYAGLTKIASVAEEIKNPGRNIPLGMMLSIISTTLIYVVGIVVMVGVLPMTDFQASLTPVADAADVALGWMPGELGLILVVASAVAAFASTGNAGILAASRYPMAMGRDHLLPRVFALLNPRTNTPIFSILFTSALMIFAIVALDESAIAKVASTFQLLIFMLVNVTVIVMRESKIEFYDPIYRTPFYPAMQIAGVLASLFLMSYIGTNALVTTLVVVLAALMWYAIYAHEKVERHGAIFHWFARLGEQRYEGLENELHQILREKGLREEDPFDEVVTRATVIDIQRPTTLTDITMEASRVLTQKYPMLEESELVEGFLKSMGNNYTLVSQGATTPNLRLKAMDHTELIMIRTREGVLVNHDSDQDTAKVKVHAFFFVVGPADNPGRHLRILAQVINHIETEDFTQAWEIASNEQEMKEILLHSERMLTLWLREDTRTARLINTPLRQIQMPEGTLVALIRRDDEMLIPRGNTELQAGDRITIIGDPDDIQWLFEEYVSDHRPSSA